MGVFWDAIVEDVVDWMICGGTLVWHNTYLCRGGQPCKEGIGFIRHDARVTLMTLQSSVMSASFDKAGGRSSSASKQAMRSANPFCFLR